LILVIEEQVDATGTVTEALGQVRWTSVPRGHKFDATTQVSLSVRPDETQVQVVQRASSKLRVISHILPTMWGAMIGGAIAASAVLSAPVGVAVGIGTALLGLSAGHLTWRSIANRGARDARRIANEVALAAAELAGETRAG
jgi:hypothetical protein